MFNKKGLEKIGLKSISNRKVMAIIININQRKEELC